MYVWLCMSMYVCMTINECMYVHFMLCIYACMFVCTYENDCDPSTHLDCGVNSRGPTERCSLSQATLHQGLLFLVMFLKFLAK